MSYQKYAYFHLLFHLLLITFPVHPILSSNWIFTNRVQPHIIPSPTIDRPRDPDVHTRIPPFKSNSIKLLQPSSFAKLCDKYGRMAWIIPVRGAPLIAGASGAIFSKNPASEVLTQPGYNVSAKPTTTAIAVAVAAVAEGHDVSSAQKASILQWTAPTLTHFWMFLLRLHETTVFGPLAISFQPRQFAPLLRPTPEVRWGLDAFETVAVDGEEAKQRRRWLGERFAETDYIKIYHDATFALNLRQLIEKYRDDEMVREWCSPKGLGTSMTIDKDKSKEEHGNVKRRVKGNNKDKGKARRPFKGINLLLVDEVGEPFLIA